MNIIIILSSFFISIIILIELENRLKPSSPLNLKPNNWKVKSDPLHINVTGWLEIENHHHRTEVMIPEFNINPILLMTNKSNNIKIITKLTTHHKDAENRKLETIIPMRK